jgi:hypothetical protein
MVEQLTLNQRVAGSSPARFTTYLFSIEDVAADFSLEGSSGISRV